jgi:hypothetical protein
MLLTAGSQAAVWTEVIASTLSSHSVMPAQDLAVSKKSVPGTCRHFDVHVLVTSSLHTSKSRTETFWTHPSGVYLLSFICWRLAPTCLVALCRCWSAPAICVDASREASLRGFGCFQRSKVVCRRLSVKPQATNTFCHLSLFVLPLPDVVVVVVFFITALPERRVAFTFS